MFWSGLFWYNGFRPFELDTQPVREQQYHFCQGYYVLSLCAIEHHTYHVVPHLFLAVDSKQRGDNHLAGFESVENLVEGEYVAIEEI